jgi:hypothetical protein
MDYDSLALAGFNMNIEMIFEIFLVDHLGSAKDLTLLFLLS